MTDTLIEEYETIVAEVGMEATDDEIVSCLVRDAEWTEKGARAVLWLARTYGVFVLRNALALANAMEVEDGEAGL